MIARITDNRK